MAWPPPSTIPDDPIVARWWREAELAREAEDQRAEIRAAAEQAIRPRQIRRRIQRINEQLTLAAGAGTGNREAPLQPVEFRSASVADVKFQQRIIEVVAVPYEEPAFIEYRGEMWNEVFSRGAFDGIETQQDQIRVNRNHDKSLTVGKVVRWWPERSEGLVSEVRIAPTHRGDETLTLADEDMLSASIGFAVRGRDQLLDKTSMVRRIKKAFVDHLSFVESPSYPRAEVLAVR